jgi:FkbM family methyltransferase
MALSRKRGRAPLDKLKKASRDVLLTLSLYYPYLRLRFGKDTRTESQRKVYAQFIRPGDLVFDVGANVGQRSAIFRALGARVVAIEPNPECIQHLRSRFRFSRRIVIEPVALAAVEGHAVLHIGESHNLTTLSEHFLNKVGPCRFPGTTWDTQLPVRTATLDQLISRHGLPHFLKIDVEGYELSVLNGLSLTPPMISLEFTPEIMDEAARCVERLAALSVSYRFNHCWGEELAFVLPDHVDATVFIRDVIPCMAKQSQFGDIYAVLTE